VQKFGGFHTADKLARVQAYLGSFTSRMQGKPFGLEYIDACAGDGSWTPACPPQRRVFFPQEVQEFEGSARIALQAEPRFDRYTWIEKDPDHFEKLKQLREEFPDLRDRIKLKKGDANAHLRELCEKRDWTRWRAVLFLDPFGMGIEWATIEAVAQTGAIDLWCLFPMGAVNRLLRRDGRIHAGRSHRLDLVFGSHDWFHTFYRVKTQQTFLGPITGTIKAARFQQLGEYFVSRLRSVFAGMARRQLPIYSGQNLLFWLCFAAGDKETAPEAVKAAESILATLPSDLRGCRTRPK
jgi:three-Cys-motif partner protein